MQTHPVSAALPPASGNPTRTQHTDGQANAGGSSFSAVLTGQQSTRQAAAQSPVPGNPNTAGSAGKAGDKKTPASDKAATDEDGGALQAAAQAQAAADQGLGLPQIALGIAIQAAAAQHPATARGAASTLADAHGKVLPGTLPEATARGATPILADVEGAGLPGAAREALAPGAAALQTPALDAAQKTDQSLPSATAAALSLKAADIAVVAQAPAAGAAATLAASPAVPAGNKAMALTGAQQARLAALSQKPEPASGKAALAPAAAADAAVSGANDAMATRLATTAFPSDAAPAASTPATGSFAATMQAVQVINNAAPGALPFTTAQPAVATPLQNPQWSADFGRQFISLTQGGHNMPHTAELRLDPPELGPLRITINISDNVAHAIFASPHAAVRQTVENALPQLQQMLAQAGISLGQTTVNDQAQQEQAYNDTFGGSRKQASGANAADGGTDGTLVASQTTARQTAPNALVDTFA